MSKISQKPSSVGFPASILLAIGSLLAVLMVFLLLPTISSLQDGEKPDLTVRDVKLLKLPEPPEEPSESNESTPDSINFTPIPVLSTEKPQPRLTPLAIDTGAPPMPVAQSQDVGLLQFSMAEIHAIEPGVFSLSEVDVRPVPILQTPPKYPWELRRARVEGQAVVLFKIGIDGKSSDISVESATHESFGKAAADAISKWRYKTAEREGEPVVCTVKMAVPFKLR